MAADIKVYQGNQIGGCITVISTNKTKIVIDFGESLPGSEIVENIEFDWRKEKVDAVFFTHYHGDHIGRFMEIPDDVDLYMGDVTFKVMLNIRKCIRDGETAVHKLMERLENGSITFIERGVPIEVNDDITVTGYEVDRSAFDTFMYYVEADGTNILHTGDFRDHGHRGHVIKNGVDHNIILDVIDYYILQNGRRKVDILITEGTMMGERSNEKRFSEKDLMTWAADFYGAKQLPFLPDFDGEEDLEAQKILDEMRKKGFVAIVGEYDYYERIMNALSDVNPKMIYSMWDGYLNPKKPAYNEKLAIFCQKYNAIIKHTSGHAYPELIEQVINKVNPTQRIWPIHTENVKGFLDLNISDELKGKVRIDG